MFHYRSFLIVITFSSILVPVIYGQDDLNTLEELTKLQAEVKKTEEDINALHKIIDEKMRVVRVARDGNLVHKRKLQNQLTQIKEKLVYEKEASEIEKLDSEKLSIEKSLLKIEIENNKIFEWFPELNNQ